MRSTRVTPALLLALVGLAGCIDEGHPGSVEASVAANDRPGGPVIALIDTGINPYHEAFRAAPGKGVEAHAAGWGAEVVPLAAEGDLPDRLEADKAVWDALEPGKLYAFAGTRVLGISLSRSTDDAYLYDAVGHGTETMSVAAREAPEAVLVMIQVDVRWCPSRCLAPLPLAPALEWVAAQPWIDVVSISVAYPGNVPQPSAANPDAQPALAASRKVADSGKMIIAAAGNHVVPSLQMYVEGPPWIVAVGGAQAKPHGEATFASRGVDVVANYSEWTAHPRSIDGMWWSFGTSYAAPGVAAVMAQALQMARDQGGVDSVPPALLRAALNATGAHFAATAWNPTSQPTNQTTANLASTHLPVVFAPAQMGWGYVDGGMAREIARRVLEQDFSMPPEKAQTAAYMAQWQSLREEYWRNAA